MNGEHQGLYLDIEHVGKDGLGHHGHERGAAIYRCGHRSCELTWDARTARRGPPVGSERRRGPRTVAPPVHPAAGTVYGRRGDGTGEDFEPRPREQVEHDTRAR
ncbi:CotH kinase family protein [Myxococcus sp. AB056]|uniref:CotH kinase family protein n=1 Tax=Myxococcus sp. AB056 TaxID=2562792 RepID=UPI0021030153|nr:CotH kinase family protein [Myxococcus sp. AB056]